MLMETPLTEDEERFMRWLEEGDVHGHHAGVGFDVPPHWHSMKCDIENLGGLLRAHLPAAIEPPDAEIFNRRVQERLE